MLVLMSGIPTLWVELYVKLTLKMMALETPLWLFKAMTTRMITTGLFVQV
ncbi:MAG: hypothetical protein ETSY2_18520 [Candidatus Entotheonella gemina]|uniref:Uncharacterized protein n=1 Tax=Candidatus Entotheonella gemina TaxID=1429439 RepID=W4M7L3_9BACT|nr:MAG: hypothetical protein ETSY2_18520 [Candidatus Entotheonella gemina]